MPDAGNAVTGPMSVSVIAGPSAETVISGLRANIGKRFAIFEPDAQSRPEEIVSRLRATAVKGEADHLIILCEAERPLMAYAFLFADELADVSQLTSAAFAIDSETLLDSLLDRKANSLSASFIAEQMEFASDIFLDRAHGPDFELARSITTALNPRARVSPLTDADVSAWMDRRAAKFDFDQALNGAGWRKLLDPEQPSGN
jgi:hypothetical protein